MQASAPGGVAAARSAGGASRRTVALGPRDGLVVAALVALAAAVRLHGLLAAGVWLDEGYSLLQSERSLGDIVLLTRFDASPPLYILLLHAWRSAFGPSVLAAKALSLLAGTAGVAGAWLVARLRFGALAAAVAGLLVALSRDHVHYSQEIRCYAVLFALFALCDACFARWDERGAPRDLAGWVGFGLASVLTHHFAWWMLACQAVAARRRRTALLALGGVFLASTPALGALAYHVATFKTQQWIPTPDAAALLQSLWVLGGCGPVAALVWGMAVLGAVAHFAGTLPSALARPGAGARVAAAPALQLAMPFAFWIASIAALPMLVERYLLLALLPLAGLAGAGVAALRAPAVRILLVGAFVAGAVGPLREQVAQEDRAAARQELSRTLLEGYRDGDVIFHTSKWTFAPFAAQHRAAMAEYLLPPLEGEEYSAILLHYTSRRVRRDPPAPREYARLWLVLRPEDNPDEVVGTPWLRALGPRLAWAHPSGLLLRFDLGS